MGCFRVLWDRLPFVFSLLSSVFDSIYYLPSEVVLEKGTSSHILESEVLALSWELIRVCFILDAIGMQGGLEPRTGKALVRQQDTFLSLAVMFSKVRLSFKA